MIGGIDSIAPSITVNEQSELNPVCSFHYSIEVFCFREIISPDFIDDDCSLTVMKDVLLSTSPCTGWFVSYFRTDDVAFLNYLSSISTDCPVPRDLVNSVNFVGMLETLTFPLPFLYMLAANFEDLR